MTSKVFIPKIIIENLRDNSKLDDTLELKEEFIKYEGDINTIFKLFFVNHFMSSIKANCYQIETYIQEFYTINEDDYSCTNGLVQISLSGKNNQMIQYEIGNSYLNEVLHKNDFKYREIDILAHYAKMETVIEYILPQNKLLINELYKTNDPVESKNSFDQCFGAIDASIAKNGESLVAQIFSMFRRSSSLKKDYKKMIRSISFSTNTSEKKAHGLPTMWAHYGQNHKGICLVFDRIIIERLFEDQFNSKFKQNPISYDKLKLPTFKNEVIENSEEFFLKHAEKLFFTKDSDWGSESEYRFVVVKENCCPTKDETDINKCYLKNIDEALIAIVLGIDFNENYLPSVEKILQDLTKSDFGVYRLKFEKGEFALFETNKINIFNYYIVES